MADLRVQQAAPVQPAPVNTDAQGSNARRDEQSPRERRERPGAEELAVALAEDGRTAMEARYEQDADGNAQIRIVDTERGETVAVVSPEELRAMAEQTGLPPGLLVRTSS